MEKTIMSIDNQLREAERKMKESPGDVEAIKKWMKLNMKAGAEVKCRWKIKQNEKYLSKNQFGRYVWADAGASFTTQDKAIKYLIKALDKVNHRYGPSITDEAKIVMCQTYTTEEPIEVNLELYKREAELEKIKQKQKKLENEAKKLAQEMAKQQAELDRKTRDLKRKAKKLEAGDVD